MADLQAEKDQQALRAVQRFCTVPYNDHGTKDRNGLYSHDWAFLVQEVFHVYHGQTLNVEQAKPHAKVIRESYPNRWDWNDTVGSLEAQEDILRIIKNRLGLAHSP